MPPTPYPFRTVLDGVWLVCQPLGMTLREASPALRKQGSQVLLDD